jgi:4-amino-4-deoxy-L-arabinose transferase-like glycosyltransferase
MAEAGPAVTTIREPTTEPWDSREPATAPGSRVAATRRRRQRQLTFLSILAFALVLAAGTGLRLWHLGVSPAWQWDEAVYYRVSINVQHGLLSEHSLYHNYEPFLYQPPFYFLLLSRWFSLVGASIWHARVLGVLLTAAMQALLFRLLWKIHGPTTALFAVIPVIFDGWLMYIERVSYMENALMVLIVTGFLLYQRALEKPSLLRFTLAGAVIGLAGSFKQTGVYILLAVLLCWLVSRRSHRGHLVLAIVALAVMVTYVMVMVRVFDVPHHDWYIGQSTTQVRRVLGLQHSGGTLTSPHGVLHLLAAQYKFFIPSVLLALVSFIMVVRRVLRCYRARSWEPAQDNALLFSWLVTGIVVFGLSSLKFPQYFVLILLPAYCFLWTEVARWDWQRIWRRTAMVAATMTGLGSFLLVVPAFSVNSLAEVQQYAATQIPVDNIVVTEQSIGDLIQQRWCTVEEATNCLHAARYAITWRTYLQSSFKQGDTAFHELMVGAVPVKSFPGAVGTATVWKLRPQG